MNVNGLADGLGHTPDANGQSEKENPGAQAGATGAKFFHQEKIRERGSAKDRYLEYTIRGHRATALAVAIGDAHPDDARQLLTAALIDLSAGVPDGGVFGSIREDAKWWAGSATPAELLEVTRAALDALRDRALHRQHREALMAVLWRKADCDTRQRFLAWANGDAHE